MVKVDRLIEHTVYILSKPFRFRVLEILLLVLKLLVSVHVPVRTFGLAS
jgi:hypothetical protein